MLARAVVCPVVLVQLHVVVVVRVRVRPRSLAQEAVKVLALHVGENLAVAVEAEAAELALRVALRESGKMRAERAIRRDRAAGVVDQKGKAIGVRVTRRQRCDGFLARALKPAAPSSFSTSAAPLQRCLSRSA